MPIMRWNPFELIPARMGWRWPSRWAGWEDLLAPSLSGWWPRMDVYSKGKDLVIKAEVPGASPEDISVDLEDNVLTISGKRAHEEEVREDDYYRRECAYGSFCRSIPLPKGVTEKDITARLKDGVLEVVVKGAGEAAPPRRRIPIQKGD